MAQCVKALLYKPEGRVHDSQFVVGIFHLHNPSKPEVDSDCKRHEYQEYRLGGKAAGA
jgi:hypothetical protein